MYTCSDVPSQDVLERLQSSGFAQSGRSLVDVYLGKETFHTEIQGIPHAMLNGWLGSVPYQNGMTYGDLFQLVRQLIPVSMEIIYIVYQDTSINRTHQLTGQCCPVSCT